MRMSLIAAVAAFGLIAAACTIDVEPNADGSLTVQSVIHEERVQQAIAANAKQGDSLEVEFHDGFIAVEGTGTDERTGRFNSVSFKATLGVVDGHLTADLYDAIWNDEPMPLWIVEAWNTELANTLEREGNENPDDTLQDVVVGQTDITMVWHVETEASKG